MTTPKKQREYPRVSNIKDPDIKETVRLLWDRYHDISDSVNTHATQLEQAQTTSATQTSQITTLNTQMTQALAGGGIATRSTVPGGGSSGTSGGSGSGTTGGGTPTPPAPTDIPNQSGVVAQAKADLIAGGIDISGPCGAFAITNLAAFRLGGNYGILSKPSGNNCNGYSVDIIAVKSTATNPQMPIYDVLMDAGASDGPSWNFNSFVSIDLWRSPVTPPI